MHNLGPSIGALLFRHPQSKVFTDAVLKDKTLKDVFKYEAEHTERVAMVYRNTGSGNSVQLLILSELLLQSAWRKLPPNELTSDTFVSAAVDQLRLVRDVFAGKQRFLTAKLAFTGILLPPGRELELHDGLVRAVNDAERRFVPESLKGQLSGTYASGNPTTINYDGDVVLEYAIPYEVRVQHGSENASLSWSLEMRPPLAMEQAVMRLRYSLMLAVRREYRAQLVQTWRAFDEPFSHNIVTSWSDPRQGAGFTPTQLTDSEVEAWGRWYESLNTPHVAKIDLALTRILRAIAERREPSDVLIDSVIAWENLFGTKEGEPTFRVTMCLAKLLEQTSEARLELRARLGKIYALRSKIVHGGGTLRQAEYPLCNEALDTAIRAIEVLLTDRIDILTLADGAQRSATLLLGQ
jgi:hypothetical protein